MSSRFCTLRGRHADISVYTSAFPTTGYVPYILQSRSRRSTCSSRFVLSLVSIDSHPGGVSAGQSEVRSSLVPTDSFCPD